VERQGDLERERLKYLRLKSAIAILKLVIETEYKLIHILLKSGFTILRFASACESYYLKSSGGKSMHYLEPKVSRPLGERSIAKNIPPILQHSTHYLHHLYVKYNYIKI